MNRTLRALLALAVTALATLAVAAPARAADPVVIEGSVTSTPDNFCPAWARDTFTRITTITETGPNSYDIRQDISGTWISTANPDIHGTITGYEEYTVAGTLLGDPESVDDDVDLSSYACKTDVPDGPDKSSKWALRYFEDDAKADALTGWGYTYDTACEEPYTENAQSGAMGPDVFTEVCPEPTRTTETKTAEPTDEPTQTPTARDTVTQTTAPVTTTTLAPGLAKTGSSLTPVLIAGAVLIVSGAGVLGVVGWRRRREN